jgi:hypothetical protein
VSAAFFTTIVSGEDGVQHVSNLRALPQGWAIQTWKVPAVFPLVMDHPEDFLPASLLPSDLILSFAENKSVAEFLPEMAMMAGALKYCRRLTPSLIKLYTWQNWATQFARLSL